MKDWKDTPSFNSNADPWYLCVARFSRSMAPYEAMPNVSRDHDDGNQVRVVKSIKMFYMTTPMTRASIQMLKLQSVGERLYLQHDEAQCQVCLT